MKIRLVKRKNPQNRSQSKFYANAVNTGRITLRDISKDIAGRSCSHGVISKVCC